MMEKIALASSLGFSAGGSRPIYMAEVEGEKTAGESDVLKSVRDFLHSVEPEEDTRYLLVNAMGAHEYWGPNSNNDAWPEAALCHLPQGWRGVPVLDKSLCESRSWLKVQPKYPFQGWPYGLPTFYKAHAFAQHANKDPNRKVGDVVFADWNDAMKRVELVMKLTKELCSKHNAQHFWERMANGEFPAVSMGSKVPFDRCSISTDMDEFYAALASYDPVIHEHPGIAVLRWHVDKIKRTGSGIPGIARTRAEYGPLMRMMAGKIDPKSGRKVFVYNDFPKFFDISLVRVGADKTAYSMISIGPGERMRTKIAATVDDPSLLNGLGRLSSRTTNSLSSMLAEPMGGASFQEALSNYGRSSLEVHPKLAALLLPPSWMLKESFDPSFYETQEKEAADMQRQIKSAMQKKRGEIDKRIPGEVMRVTKGESDFPDDLLDDLSKHPLEEGLGTCGSLGMVLRPREFLRMALSRACPAMRDHADLIDLPATPAKHPPMSLRMLPELLSKILPFMPERSGYDAPLRTRITVMIVKPEEGSEKKARQRLLATASLPEELLSKLGSLYQSYRAGLMMYLPHAQTDLLQYGDATKVASLTQPDPQDLFTPLSYGYFAQAYLDELSTR